MTGDVPVSGEVRPPLRALLAESTGLSDEKVLWRIWSHVFPMRLRAADTVRFLVTGHALTAEWDLVRALSACASTDAIKAVFSDYRHSPVRLPGALRVLFGEPRQRKAVALYRGLKDAWHARRPERS
jgi:hypothetical protein